MTSPRPAWHVPPDARARAWVERVVGGGREVIRVRRLAGGVATAVDMVTLAAAGGAPLDVVLRRWLRPGWREEDPRRHPGHEAAILRAVAGSALPFAVPGVLAVDESGPDAGVPSILLERLPGHRPPLSREASAARLAGYGAALAAIHDLGGPVRRLVPRFEPFYPLEPRRAPASTRRPALWARAHEVLATEPAPAPDVLLHRDLHPANTLWSGSRLAGVVDWTLASHGPAGADLGHLRANLGPRHGIAAADRALDGYRAVSGATPPDQAWWDVRMLLDWIDDPGAFAPPELEPVEAYLDAVLRRA